MIRIEILGNILSIICLQTFFIIRFTEKFADFASKFKFNIKSTFALTISYWALKLWKVCYFLQNPMLCTPGMCFVPKNGVELENRGKGRQCLARVWRALLWTGLTQMNRTSQIVYTICLSYAILLPTAVCLSACFLLFLFFILEARVLCFPF